MVRKKFFSFRNTLGAALTLSAAAVLTFTVCGGDSGGGGGDPVGPSDPTGSCTVAGNCTNGVAQSACASQGGTFAAGATCGSQIVTGSCTVGGQCTNGVASTACTGTFVAGQACPVQQTYTHYCGANCTPTTSSSATPPAGCWATLGAGGCVVQGGGTVYYCLADCNPTAPLPANPSPSTCFDNVNTCVLNQTGPPPTYTHYCGTACTPTVSASATPPAGCWATLGAGGCQVQGGPGPNPTGQFCCFPGECHEIDPTATWDDAITSAADCTSKGGTVSATDTPPTADGWCGWGTPSNPSPDECSQVSASINVTDDAGNVRNQVQNCQVNSFTQTVYATEAECHAAMLGLAGATEYFCMWASAGNIACHVLQNPTGPAPTGAMCSEGTVPCATALQNCTENGLQNSPYSSLTACNAAIPTSLEYCDWGVWNGTTGGCYPIGNADQRANCVLHGTVVTTCPRGEGQF